MKTDVRWTEVRENREETEDIKANAQFERLVKKLRCELLDDSQQESTDNKTSLGVTSRRPQTILKAILDAILERPPGASKRKVRLTLQRVTQGATVEEKETKGICRPP